MNGYVVEKQAKGAALTSANVFAEDIDDMSLLEYWEERLVKLGIEHSIAYRTKKGKIVYTIFAKIKGKGSLFK